MEANLKEKTGQSLEQWKAELQPKGFKKHGEIMTYLKKERGITHGFANFIALKFREADAASHCEEDLIANQYKGKDGLVPIYEALLAFVKNLGEDVEVVPKKAAVSCKCKRQFTLIQPSTKTRIDLGLKFNDMPYSERLETSGPFGTMCTHRVRLTSVEQVDDELKQWITQAFNEAK